LDKKTIIAIFLILIVYLLSQQFLWKKKPLATDNNTPAQTQNEVMQTEDQKSTEQNINPITPSAVTADTLISVEINNSIILENEHAIYSFSNMGGVINSITLKDYTLPDSDELVQLIPPGNSLADIILKGKEKEEKLGKLAFEFEYITEKEHQGIRFFKKVDDKVVLEKRFLLTNDYNLDFTFISEGYISSTGYDILMDSGINDTEKNLKYKSSEYMILGQIDNKIEKSSLSKLKKTQIKEGKIDWAVTKSKYFVFALMPEKRLNAYKMTAYSKNDSPALRLSTQNDLDREDFQDNYQLYLGPDISENLKSYQIGLENIIQVWKPLRPLSIYFLKFIQFLYKMIPNYGIAIVIFAILLKLIFSPLNHKMQVSSQRMQDLQPKIREIQKKYKSDPRQMNAEMGKLYKQEGVNPLGGCLPLLVQMPILFAIYPAFRYNVALRHSGFMLWLKDLSAPDPYYILPILMGVFMFIQSKLMQPPAQDLANMDEKQRAALQSQKIMTYAMPVMMLFMFASMPSGLVLYWTVYNILAVAQQYFLKKKLQKVVS